MAVILGIETSCDETAAAVVSHGEEILSNAVFSQIARHQPYGGVVPEIASREHLRAIVPVVRKALTDAQHSLDSIDALAVTRGPGLAGALLVGISFAKAVGFAARKPLICVNHLEGHIHAVLLENRQQRKLEIQFPALALVVSGGHTHLFLAAPGGPTWKYRNLGRTLDDAAGEAFDKVAKLLGLGYPGGPIIDSLAKHGNPKAVKFALSQIKCKPYREQLLPERVDFSFSGIKTAVLRHVETHSLGESIARRKNALARILQPGIDDYLAHCDQQTLDLIASFQDAVVEDLVRKTISAAERHGVASILVTGGVAANRNLREIFEKRGAEHGLPVFFPSPPLSTDNAAMIAAAAHPKFLAREFAEPEFSADASLSLG